MALSDVLHRSIFRRASTTTIAIFAAAIIYEKGVDYISLEIFNACNKGKRFEDIRRQLEK